MTEEEDLFTRHYRRRFKKKFRRFNKRKKLTRSIPFAVMIGDKKKVRIAETGCALVNTVGTDWPGTEIDIVCSDKHAAAFNRVWEGYGESLITPVEFQDVTALTYPDNSFDIVLCRNVLDHLEDIPKALEELKRVSKEWVFLIHGLNQLDVYQGHHRWNALFEKNKCVFRNEKTTIILGDEWKIRFDGQFVSALLKK